MAVTGITYEQVASVTRQYVDIGVKFSKDFGAYILETASAQYEKMPEINWSRVSQMDRRYAIVAAVVLLFAYAVRYVRYGSKPESLEDRVARQAIQLLGSPKKVPVKDLHFVKRGDSLSVEKFDLSNAPKGVQIIGHLMVKPDRVTRTGPVYVKSISRRSVLAADSRAMAAVADKVRAEWWSKAK